MNATSLNELRATLAQRDVKDERMDQVRQLLFGDAIRDFDIRMTAIETRIRELDTSVARQLDAISARIAALSGEMDASRRSAFEQLSKNLLELGEHVRGISKV